MRALLEDVKTGHIQCYEVPPPELRPGGILVRTHFSSISAGTERVKVETGEKSLLQKAMARPDLVKQVIEFATQNGVKAAYDKVQARLETLSTMGYSTAGVVLAVGEGVTEFQPGDRVACAGGGYANHCEINFVPKNLAVKVPDTVPLEAAALTTIGAIAMQGLRQAQPTFGETVLVVGAGLLGVLTAQMARAAGCRVIAIDLDASRAARAQQYGAHLGLAADDPALEARVREFSHYGPDIAIITAATKSAAPLETAAKLLRDRGRIVVVGDVGMGVSRPNMFQKEISIMMSRSYGPGRYDSNYEERGQDYPIGYVRWTEQRNMQAFVEMIAAGVLNLEPLLSRRYPVEEGAKGYEDIRNSQYYTAIIEYGPREEKPMLRKQPAARKAAGTVRVGCIGAGGFARSIIFPNLKADSRVAFQSVATATGVGAESARRSFKFEQSQTPAELLTEANVDAVFVLSRHDSHAAYTRTAIENGKAVFVEKPLAINLEQLDSVRDAYDAQLVSGNAPFVMVGFNRRFAPATEKLRGFFSGRREPMMLQVRCNAGYAPADAWVHEHGGRIIGEFCHFVDWARSVVGTPITSVSAFALPDGGRYRRDNVSVALKFADGSVANLQYLANGDRSVAKEWFEVFCEGTVAQIDNFERVILSRRGKSEISKHRLDKGHNNELRLTIDAMSKGLPSPIPFSELVEVMEATCSIDEAIRSGSPVRIGEARPTTATAAAAVEEINGTRA